jgi:hypothetical protein
MHVAGLEDLFVCGRLDCELPPTSSGRRGPFDKQGGDKAIFRCPM